MDRPWSGVITAAVGSAVLTAGALTLLSKLREAERRNQELEEQIENDQPVSEQESPGFEGPEKRLEINIRADGAGDDGLLKLSRSFWDACISKLNGEIVDEMSNTVWRAYIITESSLFVSKTKAVVIPCGTTTLLQCVAFLLAGIRSAGMEVEWLQFSRKNYTYPDFQKPLHRDFTSEMKFLHNLGIHGDSHVLGPISQDHYFFFAADHIVRPTGR